MPQKAVSYELRQPFVRLAFIRKSDPWQKSLDLLVPGITLRLMKAS